MIPKWTLDAWVDYHSWKSCIPRRYIVRALQSTDYFVRKTRLKEDVDLIKKAKRRYYDISVEPDTVLEKLAWWIYSKDLDWKNFGRKYIKSVTIDRWMYLRQRNFDLINDKLKEEIEKVTEGYVSVEDWWETKEPKTWFNRTRTKRKR